MKFEYETFLKVYRDHQDKDNTFFYEHFPNADKSTIRSYKSRAKKNKVSKIVSPKVSKLPKSTNKKDPPQGIEEADLIDDPNELLMSCAMRELNKSTPDVRWGSILLTLLDKTGRLETKTKDEVMIRSKLVKYSSNQLIELRKRLTSN